MNIRCALNVKFRVLWYCIRPRYDLTQGEEEEGSRQAAAAEVVLNVSPAVGAAGPSQPALERVVRPTLINSTSK